jgi:hypothetical protein
MIGVAIGCLLIGGAAGMALVCILFVKPADRVGGKEEEGKLEVKAALPPVLAAPSEPEVKQDALDSGSDHDSSPGPEVGQDRQEEDGPARVLDSSTAGPKFDTSDGEVLARPAQAAQSDSAFEFQAQAPATVGKVAQAEPPKAESQEEVEVIECTPIRLVCAVGGRTTISIPFKKQLWARRRIQAQFDPECAGLWVSSAKGWIEPGAVEFPFQLFFSPSEEGEWETTLNVSFGEFEARVPIVATTDSGGKRRRRHRSE